MSDFINIIKRNIQHSQCMNDKRIMLVALNILDLEKVITDEELDNLDEVFAALKKDYTLSVSSDRDTLEPVVIIMNQTIPIVENKHDVCILYNILNKLNTTRIERTVLSFFDACAHIEETEVMVINQIIDMLENNWSLNGIERKFVDNREVRVLKFKTAYKSVKTLIK